jgi:hypothetical protein
VAVTSLRTVAGTSKVSINNSQDGQHKPLAKEEIRRRVTAVMERTEDWPAYNSDSNNSEHFVTWARNGVRVSTHFDEGKVYLQSRL